MTHARPLTLTLTFALAAAALAGCVQRTITVTSDPAGALVYLNDVEVGRTPVTVPFEFYGEYDVRLEREGYQTLNTSERPVGPWWENPGPDLIAEAVPDNEVRIEWFYVLSELQPIDPAGLVRRAEQMRTQLNEPVGSPLTPLPPAPNEPVPAPEDEPAPAEEPEK